MTCTVTATQLKGHHSHMSYLVFDNVRLLRLSFLGPLVFEIVCTDSWYMVYRY